ncbi:hypothetical protein BBO99_00006696 [Phytophthora kernoviae]|uniref:SCP domain-containing protein n=2 Tax=Phytophthora kernoviae TaxID=325452 RepID=A0A3R7JXI2_9STRA|nr:hypothetical protein G195_003112 [Phytophthora kernoviae 00238/432]KAG2527709.1 hypothetical protein JM18_002316 [Phytophthora kernoviae]RLN10955.1 hypothetical protein BBI17_000752 [Phytophthora kernoviae]RLN77491.1 hypothetical protein BBO99_00006696 [Phytophthora kernoviae]
MLTASAAQGHSNDMATNNIFGHTGSDGSSMSERITAAGYVWQFAAENVAAGQVSVEAVMVSWMNSPGHRDNILNPSATMFGTALAINPGSTYVRYWTQNFASGSTESCS